MLAAQEPHILSGMQADPPPPPAPGPVNISLNLDALAGLIWQWFLDHLNDIGSAIWSALKPQLGEVAQTIWTPLTAWLEAGLRSSAEATWNSMFLSIGTLPFQLPAALTTSLPAYQAIAMNPLSVAVGGATLALVLLGLRTLFGVMVGHDHVITHISGRIIPATALAVGYVVLVTQALNLINTIAGSVPKAALAGMLAFPSSSNPALILPYAIVWLFMIWFAIRLFIRLGYGLIRFLIALVFGPVALILWAIPQTEWLTTFWLHELVGWGTTPILVGTALAFAVPLAAGQAGFLGAAVLGIGGLQVAHDVVGLLSHARGGGGGFGGPLAAVRMAAGAATGGTAAVAALPAMRAQQMADTYGYQ